MFEKMKLGFVFLALYIGLFSFRIEGASYKCAIHLPTPNNLEKLLIELNDLNPKEFSAIRKLAFEFFARVYPLPEGTAVKRLVESIHRHYGLFFSDLLGVAILNQPDAACEDPSGYRRLSMWAYGTRVGNPKTKGTYLDPDPMTTRPCHFKNQSFINNPNPPDESQLLDWARTFVWTNYFEGLSRLKFRVYIQKVFKTLMTQIEDIVRTGNFESYPHSKNLIQALKEEFGKEPVGTELQELVLNVKNLSD